MTEALATIILGGIVVAVLAGGTTWAFLQWLRKRTVLFMLRCGWFAVLLLLIGVVFVRNEPFASIEWLLPTALATGAAIFIIRDIAEQRDRHVLLVMDIGIGLVVLGIFTWIIGPGTSLPMTSVLPAIVLAGVAWVAQMLMRHWTHLEQLERAHQARLVRVGALVLVPVVVVITLLVFGGLSDSPYGGRG